VRQDGLFEEEVGVLAQELIGDNHQKFLLLVGTYVNVQEHGLQILDGLEHIVLHCGHHADAREGEDAQEEEVVDAEVDVEKF
jgi:hypothetical protein